MNLNFLYELLHSYQEKPKHSNITQTCYNELETHRWKSDNAFCLQNNRVIVEAIGRNHLSFNNYYNE